jgi:hypothetical protein
MHREAISAAQRVISRSIDATICVCVQVDAVISVFAGVLAIASTSELQV